MNFLDKRCAIALLTDTILIILLQPIQVILNNLKYDTSYLFAGCLGLSARMRSNRIVGAERSCSNNLPVLNVLKGAKMEELKLTDAMQRYFSDFFVVCDENSSGKVPVKKVLELIRSGNVNQETVNQVEERGHNLEIRDTFVVFVDCGAVLEPGDELFEQEAVLFGA